MKKDFNRSLLRIFLGYFGPHKKLFLIDMTCAGQPVHCIFYHNGNHDRGISAPVCI